MYLTTQDGRSFPLQGGISAIGRGLENTIVLADTAVSRRHAEIRWDASGVYVRDVGSANGTKVDGLRLQPGQWRAVFPNTQVVLGDEIRCQMVADVPASPQAPGMPPIARVAVQPDPLRGVIPVYQPKAPVLSQSSGQVDSGLDLLLRAVDVSLDRRKLLVTLGGAALAALAAFLAFWIATSVQRASLPLFMLFVVVGAILVWVIMSLTFGAVTQMSYADLAGRSRATVREAVGYAFRRGADFTLTPVALLVVVAVIVLVEVVIMLIGRLPYVGEILASLLFLPALAVNLFLIVVLSFGSSLIYPVIVDRGRGVSGTLVHVLVMIRHAPARVAFYLGIAGLLTLVATGVLWLLLSGALTLTLQVLTAGLGMPKLSDIVLRTVNLLPFGSANYYGGFGGSSFTYVVAARLFELGMLVALVLALAFPLVLQLSLACAVYLHVKSDVPDDARLLR